jgi:hypothetical protein
LLRIDTDKQKMLVDTLIFVSLALLALTTPTPASPTLRSTPNDTPVEIEHRTLDDIYQAALKESRTLTVAWGGDSKPSSSFH